MFSFLNTLEVLPVEQVTFISQKLAARGLDAAVMLKARTGMPGHISLNAWTANAEPLCRTIATEVACCAARRTELTLILDELCDEIENAACPSKDRSTPPGTDPASHRNIRPSIARQ